MEWICIGKCEKVGEEWGGERGVGKEYGLWGGGGMYRGGGEKWRGGGWRTLSLYSQYGRSTGTIVNMSNTM